MNRENLFIYTGQSMRPLFSEADILQVMPYNGAEINKGDVVIFRSPEEDKFIIHRVVSVAHDGIRTKGDNNSEPDPWLICRERIIGRVERTGMDAIRGGRAGLLYNEFIRGYLKAKRVLFSFLSPLYCLISEKANLSGLTARIAPLRVIAMEKKEGRELQLMIGRLFIGRLSPVSNKWEIKRPFRVFINQKSLSIERGDIR